jgi:hypothetical protein
MRRGRRVRARVLLGAVLAMLMVSVAAGAEPGIEDLLDNKVLAQLSQGVVARYYAEHPSQVANGVGAGLAKAQKKGGGHAIGESGCRTAGDLYNCDNVGLPQNEESVSACTANTNFVLEGTNDYRGLIDPEQNFTGWHWSTDGGRTVTNEGLLPPVHLISDVNHNVPSGGDPVDFLFADTAGCHAFAASLAYDPFDPFSQANGIALYRSEPSILSTCPGGSDPSCWPTRRLIVESAPGHFLDKEWMFVGVQGGVPYVWATYSDFDMTTAPPVPFNASIKAVRCDITLTTCSAPIQISTVDEDIQFSDVTIGPDGRAYITWSRIDGELEGTDQIFTHKIRVETAPGSATFGPEHVIYAEDLAIPFGGFLQANDFRIATYPKSDVAWVDGHPRVFVVWDACKFLLLGFSCEYPEIKLSYSDDAGATWSGPFVISNGGVNYFPSISVDRADPANKKLSVAWFTAKFDPQFNNEQDVVLAGLQTSKSTYKAEGLHRLTGRSNETEADPLLGGFFIGDYIEVAQVKNKSYVGYNANYRQIPVLGAGFPVNQQDNYLAITGTP